MKDWRKALDEALNRCWMKEYDRRVAAGENVMDVMFDASYGRRYTLQEIEEELEKDRYSMMDILAYDSTEQDPARKLDGDFVNDMREQIDAAKASEAMTIYANYGCLAAEKRTVYTFGNPAGSEACCDKMTVKIPDGWRLCESQMGGILLESPWGWCYDPNEILKGDTIPYFLVYDSNQKGHRYDLEVLA